jgi:hypothetical protein
VAQRTQQRRPTIPQRSTHRRAGAGGRFTRSAPTPARGRLPRRRQPAPGRGQKLMGLVRGIMPGGGTASKRSGGSRPKRALLGVAGAGVAGMAVAARRRKQGQPAHTQPQPEPRTVPDSAGEGPGSEGAA